MNLQYWINATLSLLSWLFFHTIYGMLGVAILVYLLLRDLRKTFPRFPEPALVAGLVFLVGVGTLPSIPRYRFHNEMLKLMPRNEDSSAWVSSTSRSRSLTEPLTWVNPPIDAVTRIWPQSHVVRDGQRIDSVPLENHFYEWTWRYGEERAESAVEADCVQSTIRYLRPGESGVLRPVTPAPVKMVAREKDWYCAHDWSREKDALLRWYRRHSHAHVSVVSLVSRSDDGLTYACEKACQVRVIPYVMGPVPDDGTTSDSRSAAEQLFGAKMCTDGGMTPIQIMVTWNGGIQDGYHTRHWVVLCAKAAAVVPSIGPATAQTTVEQKDDLTYTCGQACQVLAIHYFRRDEAPHDPVSTRAADQAFGAKQCADKAMAPVQIMRAWWSIRSKYSTRHWVVLCAKPQ